LARPLQIFGALAAVAALSLAGCDRRIEPFDPNEEPKQPDLSRIFPPGAEQAEAQPVLPSPPGAAEEPIRGTVALAEGLGTGVPEGAVLFLIARSGGAGGPPLAVKRIPAPRFPLEFSIGPDDGMLQSLPFQGPLRISARVDSDGDASSRHPGDLQGSAPGAYEPGASGVSLVIDEVLGAS
jgi:hypothetical protein